MAIVRTDRGIDWHSAMRAFDRSLFRCCQQAVWQPFQTEDLVRASTPNDPMPENSFERSSKRVLDPIDRVSEVLFGLIMVPHFHRLAQCGGSRSREHPHDA